VSEELSLKYIGYAKKILTLLPDLLFEQPEEGKTRVGAWLWIGILYMIGVYF